MTGEPGELKCLDESDKTLLGRLAGRRRGHCVEGVCWVSAGEGSLGEECVRVVGDKGRLFKGLSRLVCCRGKRLEVLGEEKTE